MGTGSQLNLRVSLAIVSPALNLLGSQLAKDSGKAHDWPWCGRNLKAKEPMSPAQMGGAMEISRAFHLSSKKSPSIDKVTPVSIYSGTTMERHAFIVPKQEGTSKAEKKSKYNCFLPETKTKPIFGSSSAFRAVCKMAYVLICLRYENIQVLSSNSVIS